MRRASVAGLAAVVGLGVSACTQASEEDHTGVEPMSIATVVGPNGTQVARIRLTADAERRIGIRTVPVTRSGELLRIPLSAVFLDTKGIRWVYTRPEPLSYVRQAISVATEQGPTTLASSGPAPGTQIVTVGVPELWGAETGMDD